MPADESERIDMESNEHTFGEHNNITLLSSPSLDPSQGNTHASFVALLQWYWC